jgi:hypothetical protein
VADPIGLRGRAPAHYPMLKNSENEGSRKSQFRTPNRICAGNRHDEAHAKATGGKIARAAEPLPDFPSRPPTAS